MSIQQLLTDRVTIRRIVAQTKSSTGVVTDTWGDWMTDVPASVQSRGATFRELEAGMNEQSNYVGFFMLATDVRVDDEIVFQGKTYVVTFVKNVRSHHLEVDLESGDE